jgi:hypothetical protein
MSEMKETIDKIIDYKKHYENDNIYYKEIIKEKLINNKEIIYSINNEELDPDCPADYLGENILPFYLIMDTQTKTQNYICFETSFDEVTQYNKIMKLGRVMFYIMCDNKDVYDKKSGIARHDLIAALIADEFNWTNMFGTQIHLVSDKPVAVDNNYVGRTLIFEQTTTNSIIKDQRVINKAGGKNGK